ncbi:hypothetical protein Slin15195_G122630 [Septoria linicola]|uniref:Uncharacterized protein n=1 Tax=Septoria linicola TaxID=215465 RepID=A0A9Q9B117_9PEZI|nr:hypothetical protein Slin14017_G078830 [Septoria linicola]USW58944.1 hypothetical protein Slin15195_G122630 [Septoria linicola]
MSLRSRAAAPLSMAIPESALERLPAELQNQIYELVLVYPGPITLSNTKNSGLYILTDNKINTAPGLAPSILAANRKLYSQTAPVLYGANRFKFYWRSTADLWTRQIGDSCASLREVWLNFKSWLEAMQEAVALKDLTLPGDLGSDDFGTGRLCKALQPILRNVKQARLDKGIEDGVVDIVWVGDFATSQFPQCRGVEWRLRNKLQALLRTPEEQDALDGEVLHAAQIMFDDSY